MIAPNILIMGVGHSGTTILTRFLSALGYNDNADGDPWAECPTIRTINEDYIRTNRFAFSDAQNAVLRLRRPFAIKDPRFSITLPAWEPILPHGCVGLVWLSRDLDEVKASYRRRSESVGNGAPGMYGRTVDELQGLSAARFAQWKGPKIALRHEDMCQAANLYKDL